jgi:hypothetical protein
MCHIVDLNQAFREGLHDPLASDDVLLCISVQYNHGPCRRSKVSHIYSSYSINTFFDSSESLLQQMEPTILVTFSSTAPHLPIRFRESHTTW